MDLVFDSSSFLALHLMRFKIFFIASMLGSMKNILSHLLFGFSFSSGNILYSPKSIDVDDRRNSMPAKGRWNTSMIFQVLPLLQQTICTKQFLRLFEFSIPLYKLTLGYFNRASAIYINMWIHDEFKHYNRWKSVRLSSLQRRQIENPHGISIIIYKYI